MIAYFSPEIIFALVIKMSAISDKTAEEVGERLGIDWNVVPHETWKYALDVELEHGSKLGEHTNVTGDDPLTTGRIALAHLKEFPDYYGRLKLMEKEANESWEGKYKPPPHDKDTAEKMKPGKEMLWYVAEIAVLAILILVAIFLIYRSRQERVENFTAGDVITGGPINPGVY